MPFFFDPAYMLAIAPAMLLAMWAQWRVKSSFAAASQEPAPPMDNPARRRDLNAGRPKSEPSGPGKTAGAGPDPSGRIMTGGARAGAPAIRPGYGASGPKVDLNAGRLPAGLPPARGLGPMGGSAPFRPLDRNGTIPSRGYEPVRPTITPLPRPTITAEEIGSF